MRFMHRAQGIDGLQFDDHLAINKQIQPLPIYLNVLVSHSDRHLPIHRQSAKPQLVVKGDLVYALKQAGAELTMDLDHRCQDLTAQLIKFLRELLRQGRFGPLSCSHGPVLATVSTMPKCPP
ncbi:MAG: hypothetical protein AMJ81_09065 [Phycisphaerae bacterium SM23_33]|nr:MAG: hypothetical protein AMJ81_09065 [Phycisphaerae bacterium SM23_33]